MANPSVKESTHNEMGKDPLWFISDDKKRTWVDFQNDVTLKDIKLSHQEGFVSVEHLKRYTTLGMATGPRQEFKFDRLSCYGPYNRKTN